MKPVRGENSRRESLFGGKQASVGLGLAVLLTIMTAMVAAIGSSIGAGNNQYEVSIHFPTGNGIIEGSDVFFGGVKVGTVKTLQLDQDGKAITMTVSIGQQYAPIHQGATAAIRPKSLLGEKYVSMTVGDPSKPAYKNGDSLPESVTSVNVELDQIINIFDEPTRKQLQVLIDQLGLGVAGQGRNTNETLQSGTQDLTALATVTDTLQARDAELKQIIEALTKLTATLSTDQQRQTYVALLAHSDTVLKTLKDEDANVKQGIDRMNSLFGTFDAGLNGRQQDLNAVFQELPNTVTDLDNLSVNLGREGHIGFPVLQKSIPGIVSAPLIFGTRSNSNQYTGNIWTRVMTAVGCFYVNHRTRDANGFYTDTPNTPILTTQGGGQSTFTSTGSAGGTLCSGALGGLDLTTICKTLPPNPITPTVCPGAAGTAASTSSGRSGASASSSRAGNTPQGIVPQDNLPPGSEQAQRDLLDYLVH
ncbi:MAG: MlaD family protein [Candidatus Dormibacteria bacterium]